VRTAIGAVLTLVLLGGAAQARDVVAEGRYHLRKANALAGDDRCAAAIHEYTLAFEKLHDPVVLFNRAECARRIGDAAAAAADYRSFLTAVPRAPNRAEIEAKIAALAPEPPPPSRTTPSAQARPLAPLAPPPATPPEPAPYALAAPAPPPPEAPAAPVIAAPAPVETVETAPSAATESRGGHAWLWAALGAAVAGGAVGAYLVLRTPGATPPATELGNYRF